MYKIEKMTGRTGRPVKNQVIIYEEDGIYFKSYDSIIAKRDNNGNIILDRNYWDYSNTTGKYRNTFLGEDRKETQRKIDQGIYQLANLN